MTDRKDEQSFELLERIDSGIYGAVYKAKDIKLEREVAVKILHPSQHLLQTIDQARALARATHPNIVQVYSVTKVQHPESELLVDAIVMELLSGEKLEQLVDKSALSISTIKDFGIKILSAVKHLHSRGIAHGDLHSGNVLVHEEEPKIIDIHYLDSLAAMTTKTRASKFSLDFRLIAMLFFEMLMSCSDVDVQKAYEFNSEVRSVDNLNVIRDLFLSVVDAENVEEKKREKVPVQVAKKKSSSGSSFLERWFNLNQAPIKMINLTPEEKAKKAKELSAKVDKSIDLGRRETVIRYQRINELDEVEETFLQTSINSIFENIAPLIRWSIDEEDFELLLNDFIFEYEANESSDKRVNHRVSIEKSYVKKTIERLRYLDVIAYESANQYRYSVTSFGKTVLDKLFADWSKEQSS